MLQPQQWIPYTFSAGILELKNDKIQVNGSGTASPFGFGSQRPCFGQGKTSEGLINKKWWGVFLKHRRKKSRVRCFGRGFRYDLAREEEMILDTSFAIAYSISR